ncbi:MAG: hypothetical protein HC836_37120 [Richelia sp. RM2_1_2]|nr:hypothetical protein [Richelia sp. RM2_1_2]
MYLTLTLKNINKAVIDDDGWGSLETSKYRWERLEPGIWLNISLNEKAIRQVNGTWFYMNKNYSSIKDIMRHSIKIAA